MLAFNHTICVSVLECVDSVLIDFRNMECVNSLVFLVSLRLLLSSSWIHLWPVFKTNCGEDLKYNPWIRLRLDSL